VKDPKYKEILQNIMSPQQIPVANIIGSGNYVVSQKRRGSGIKKF